MAERESESGNNADNEEDDEDEKEQDDKFEEIIVDQLEETSMSDVEAKGAIAGAEEEEEEETQEQWASMQQILEEVSVLAHEKTELEAVEGAGKLAREVRERYARAKDNAAEAIRKCTQDVTDAREKAEAFAAQTPTSPEIEALEQERIALLKRLEDANEDQDALLKLVADLEAKVARTEEELKLARQAEDKALPKMMHSLSLYSTISKIKWDLESSNPRKGVFQGTVVNPDEGYVKDFRIDEGSKTPFQVANQLWDIINAA
ncbi:Kinetochore protein Spc24 [Hondaea fermentalgiana]|uniref:Kinetochore protein Spc24 n=1 Tax=Hondaea fermentalgiana TaxID=2315210 RepID=A0A2R5GU96_9STRA|nr:Kinetochore protein Spc24 [Hondaea fermentalgiana]|eukprot:GBG33328.1 Kinetochore protein Spc24 [Hondaea fermentalgiana]